MNRIAWIFILALVVGLVPGLADTNWTFNYTGVTNPTITGSGTFVTGTPYANGYLPILSITGITNFGAIVGLETSGGVGIEPPGTLNFNGTYIYDNAFFPIGPNHFTNPGLLFNVATGAPFSPINIYGTNTPGTYEFSYGANSYNSADPAGGGDEITFSATNVPDGGTTLALLGLAIAGLAGLRRKL